MIKCEKTERGGKITVLNEGKKSSLIFSLSDATQTPLSMRVECETGSDHDVLLSVTENLVQRYSSPVVFLKTESAQLRYCPWIGNSVYRHSTKKLETLYTRPFTPSKPFDRVWSLAESMSDYSFVRSSGDELRFFDRYAIFGQLRKHLKPLEFLSVKEECDYGVQKACVATNRFMLDTAEQHLSHTGKYSEAFNEVISRVQNMQQGGCVSFHKTSYLRETIEQILLPAVVLFGTGNPFTKSIMESFVSGAAEYTSVSEGFLETYEESLKYLNEQK
jgi:hypothetical protein